LDAQGKATWHFPQQFNLFFDPEASHRAVSGNLVRGFKKQRVIGDPRDGLGRRDCLPTSAARTKAAIMYAELSSGESAPRKPAPSPAAKVWTWADLDREYQAMMAAPRWVNRRLKAPSQGTYDDVRLTFAKAPMQALHSEAIDSKLLGCDVVAIRVEDVAPSGYTIIYRPYPAAQKSSDPAPLTQGIPGS
jgi:hypothetical protein